MDRKTFIAASAALGAGAVLGTDAAVDEATPRPQGGPYVTREGAADLVLRGATVFDGSGGPGREVDVSIVGDRIEQVGRVPQAGAEEIDLTGLALAPGFIDIHSHADTSLLAAPLAESRIRQGVTLEVVGQDGGSVGPWPEERARATRDRYRREYGLDVQFGSIRGFLDGIDRVRPTVNVASMVGQGTIRALATGFEDRPATDREIEVMRRHVREALAGGAVGLSSGLEYTPGGFAPTSELVELARELSGTNYPYASHMRNEDDRLLGAVEEALQVGKLAGVSVQISHLKAQGERNWWKADAALHMVEEAASSGVDVHFDRYPYLAYSTGLSNLFPAELRAGGNEAFLMRLTDPETAPRMERAARSKVALLGSWDAVQIVGAPAGELGRIQGARLGTAASELGVDPYSLTVRLLKEGDGRVGMIGFGMSEENTERVLAHPRSMVCSDGGSYAPYGQSGQSSPHPRVYGSFPRVLGHYVRERRIMPLATAIQKMTSMPASKIGLQDRGVIRAGALADLVAFDPSSVIDRATFEDPHHYPEGIPLVIVNGVVTIRGGDQTGQRAGRSIRGSAYRDS